MLANAFGLTVKVAHYPSGASKWNPIEHQLFSEVSKNWAGVPLESMDIVLNYLRTTATRIGRTVTAKLMEGVYERGYKVSKEDRVQVNLKYHLDIPQWNYTINPQNQQVIV